jgi:hypothetical protein
MTTKIFCVQCRTTTPATKRRGAIGGAGGTVWLNVCLRIVDEKTGQRCGHQHPAPPPGLAARNRQQRSTVRLRQYLERKGQTTMFTKGGR